MTADFGSRGHVERPGVWGPRIALGVGCVVILFAAVIAAGAALSKATKDGSQMLGPTGLLDVTRDAGLPTLITIAVFTLVAGVVGALFSLRRIAKIDPATAIGGVI